jgi:DNA-binding MarR family transcriptional regulator
LTPEDRHRIAAGMAEQRGFAEIARQLGRPTSTVSREVARNGGRESYRADHAVQATKRRAKRVGTVGRRDLPLSPDLDGRDPAALRAFVEQFSALMARTGLPRMTARVLTCLFTSDASTLTAAELVQRLRVSPASISKAISHLEELELVRRVRDPRSRRDRYIVDDGVWLRAWGASARKHLAWADVARQGVAVLGADTPAGARLAETGRFFSQLAGDMTGAVSTMPTASEDALTLVAALAHAGSALTVNQLARGLGWAVNRVTTAIDDAARNPEWTGPVTVRRLATRRYAVTDRPDQLTAAQRRRLRTGAASSGRGP